MARRKVGVTRTFGPLQFEALEPHRFEDLVRQLIYDFRDWQSIESTGRVGNDGGFDVRAFERNTRTPSAEPVQEPEDTEPPHPMEGHRWMIQAKREKSLGPTAIRKILNDVDKNDPPYGYILAAAANFSTESFDTFREILRAKGVMEFYLWGRGELEDMLHQPKNDRILFTFFGLSLVSKRRTRSTEQRASIGVKNKLFKVVGSRDGKFHTDVLLRDINDEHYPYKDKYSDFDVRPRWVERTAFQHHPRGLLVHSRRYYAFVDQIKKEWDFTTEVDLHWHQSLSDEERQEMQAAHDRVKEVWQFLPRARKAEYAVEGFVSYSDVLLVDAEGNHMHRCPHIYVEFDPETGPFSGFWRYLEVGHTKLDPSDDDWKRIEFFPTKFRAPKARTAKGAKDLALDLAELGRVGYDSKDITLIAADSRYDDLKSRDLLRPRRTNDTDLTYLRVTHVEKGPFGDYLDNFDDKFSLQRTAAFQLGRETDPAEVLTVVEVEHEYIRNDQR